MTLLAAETVTVNLWVAFLVLAIIALIVFIVRR